MKVIYVALLDEGTDVWRPVTAIELPGGLFKILPPHELHDNEEVWEFVPGSIVSIEMMTSSDGTTFPVAVCAES